MAEFLTKILDKWFGDNCDEGSLRQRSYSRSSVEYLDRDSSDVLVLRSSDKGVHIRKIAIRLAKKSVRQ